MSKVCNKKKEVDESSLMNDKDFITDILSNEKAIVNNFATMLVEMSNKSLHKEIFDLLRVCSENQSKLFELLFENGWYELEGVENDKLDQEYEKLTQMMDELE